MPAVNRLSHLVITSCTGRKKKKYDSFSFPGARRARGADELARAWVATLQGREAETVAVRDYYAGRGFSEALSVADHLDAPLGVVSAGLGLVYSTDAVTPYDLTVSGGSASISTHLSRYGQTTVDWWSALNAAWGRPYPFSRLFGAYGAVTVLVALPSTYLSMVQDELADLEPRQRQRLRIITSEAGAASLPVVLAPQAMPYDARLESDLPGTLSDFPQRALRHFVMTLEAHERPADEARQLVTGAMKHMQRRELPVRRRLSDAEICNLLRKNWDTCDGKSTKLLRYLRDEALVACEQTRFRQLWQEVYLDLDKDA